LGALLFLVSPRSESKKRREQGPQAVTTYARDLAGVDDRDRLDAYARIDSAILHYLSGDRPPVFAERVR
jgi:hypothetical protein